MRRRAATAEARLPDAGGELWAIEGIPAPWQRVRRRRIGPDERRRLERGIAELLAALGMDLETPYV